VVEQVVRPTVEEMARRGAPFAGLLYVGLALTSRGTRVVEFNVRFGDPETQAVLALLETPLGGLLHAVATGTLADHPPLRWRDGSAVTVVVASHGYPQAPRTGDPIDGLDAIEDVADVSVLHAGTGYDDTGRLVTSGGRVLSVTAVGADLSSARESAYRAVQAVRIPGGHHRTDIARSAADEEARAR
jgi:phosphoribosylamine--glycine ligase